MNLSDRQSLASAYQSAWIAAKRAPCTVTVDAAGWYTIKLNSGAALTARRVRASELLTRLAGLTATLVTQAREREA